MTDQVLECVPDMQAKAQEHDINATDVYLHVEMKQDEKMFVGHVPIELSPLLKYILEAETNSLNKSLGRGRERLGLLYRQSLNHGTAHCKNSEDRA